MSSLRPVGRFAAAHNRDRKSLCRFTFADGRLPHSPLPGHPHFCFDHARKDSQARAADKLARELSYFFSGPYLSACDLSTALGRLIAGVARGDIKPRSARTLPYLAQTLVQTIHLAQDEYINAFDTDAWRKLFRNSVKVNHDYLFPRAPKTPQNQAPQPAPAQQPAPSPHTPMPPTSAEFAQQVMAAQNSRPPQVSQGPGQQPGGTSPVPPQPQVQPPVSQPDSPRQSCPSTRPYEPNRDAPWRDFGRTIPPDSHLL